MENQMMVPMDSIERMPYKIGYSFRNPPAVWPVTHARKQFFRMNWASEGPTEKKRAMWKGGRLNRYPTVWRRASKMSTVAGLSGHEMPDFHELGAALAPTQEKDGVERSIWGTLTNTLTNVASTVMNEQQKLAIAKTQAAQAQSRQIFTPMIYSSEGGVGTLGWGMIATIVIGGGIAAYMVLKK